ncbi:MAG: hypothetical protein H7331_08645 [Bacteroidia bacterium]|nr:hypothetical protein [Bacteroidia bacterium]
MKKNITAAIVLLFTAFAFNVSTSFAQCDTIANSCLKNLGRQFVSDGQNYRSLLLDEETAEFHATFYGGSTYRLAACSGTGDGNLIIKVYDKDRNLLFSNGDHKNASYWDFKFKGTMDCTIEANLDKNKAISSGCAVLLIGFKQ